MVEKGIRGEIYHCIYRYAKANKKYKHDYDKNKELSYLQHCGVNNFYEWGMSQKLPLKNCKWIMD